MKKVIRTSLIILSLYHMPPANAGGNYLQGWGVAPETSFYGGASIGMANQSNFDEGTSHIGKLYGGVRHRSIGAELGYLKLGEVEGVGDSESERLPSTIRSDIGGLYAAAMGYVPIYYKTDLIAKAGVVYWDSERSKEVALIDVNSSDNDSGLSPLLGIGAQHQLNDNMFVRGEWEHIFATGSEDYESDADLLSVGVTYSTY